MILGINPTDGFALHEMFETSENATALISLLDTILSLQNLVVAVEILNPFSYREFADGMER